MQLFWMELERSRPRGRRLTDEERDDLFRRHPDLAAKFEARKGRNFELRDFMRKLIVRQGTHLPDFDALYRRKAELDDDPRP
jgi:hypothetical protein